jgi:ABC-type amino acid transport substrate-binding protein
MTRICPGTKQLKKLKKHEIDVLPCVGITRERENFFIYSRPYLIFPRVIITRTNDVVDNINELKGKKVGVQNKSSHHGFIIDETSIKPVLYDSFQDAIIELSNGKTDAVLGNMAAASYAIRKYGLTNLTIASHATAKTYSLAFAVRKDWPILRDLINKALDSISEQEKEVISQKWFAVNIQAPQLMESLRHKLTTKENDWLTKHRKIRIGLDPAYAPYCFMDHEGKYHGIVPEYLNLLQSRLDLEIEIVPGLAWPQILSNVKKRILDVITPTAKNPEREKFLNFSEAYLTTPLVIMTRTDNSDIHSAKDLPGKRVALVKDYFSTGKVLREYPSIKKLYVDNPLEGLRKVSNGQADAYIGVLGVNIHLASRNGINNLKVVSNYSGKDVMKQCFAVRKDWPELVSILNKALQEIPESQKTAIYSKWIPISSEADSCPEKHGLFSHKEMEWLKAHPRVKVGVDKDFAPIEFLNKQGKPVGISVDYLDIIKQKTGINFEYINQDTWQATLQMTRKEKIDLLPCFTKTPERLKYLNFTEPYLNVPVVVYTRRDVSYVGNLNELKGKKVAVVKGCAPEEWLSKDYPDIPLL